VPGGDPWSLELANQHPNLPPTKNTRKNFKPPERAEGRLISRCGGRLRALVSSNQG
jgi:hypothetical protein